MRLKYVLLTENTCNNHLVPVFLKPLSFLKLAVHFFITIMPWSAGKPLVWDTTCSDTFAASYQGVASHVAGEVAAQAEVRKEVKYANLSHSHCFIPVSVESTGVFGPRTVSFVKDLGRRITRQSGNTNATTYLRQRLSMAIQHGNALSVLGTCNFSPPLFDLP